jgi:ribonuclease P protein component
VSARARPAHTFGWAKKLRKTDEFSSVFRFRRAWRGEGLDCNIRPNGLEIARLGLIVPKKVLARAVDRNRAKRVLREVFRLRQQDVRGLDIILRVKARREPVDYRRECTAHIEASRGYLNKTAVEQSG